MRRIILTIVALNTAHCISWGQELIADIAVEVTEQAGLYTYVYSLTNAAESEVPINNLSLTTGVGAVVEEIAGPEDWTASYADTDLSFQATFIAGDGLSCEVEQFDIPPDRDATFTLVSRWAPAARDFFFSKLTTDCVEFVGSPITGFILTPSIPNPGDADSDGDVDTADVNALIANWTGALEPFTGTSLFADGDFDGDFDVDSADRTLLIQNWTGAMMAQSVPESNGFVTILVGVGTLFAAAEPRRRAMRPSRIRLN